MVFQIKQKDFILTSQTELFPFHWTLLHSYTSVCGKFFIKKKFFFILTSFIKMRTLRKSEIFLKMNVCEWLADNKLLTHFVEDKTKYILFSKEENHNITCDNITYV